MNSIELELVALNIWLEFLSVLALNIWCLYNQDSWFLFIWQLNLQIELKFLQIDTKFNLNEAPALFNHYVQAMLIDSIRQYTEAIVEVAGVKL